MNSPIPSKRQAAPARWLALAWALWLVWALVLVPTWGRMHGVVHPVHGDAHASNSADPAHSHATPHPDTEHHHAADGLLNLLAGHGPQDCPWLDHLALGDALPTAAAWPLLHAAPTQVRSTHTPLGVHKHVVFFQARAPPHINQLIF